MVQVQVQGPGQDVVYQRAETCSCAHLTSVKKTLLHKSLALLMGHT